MHVVLAGCRADRVGSTKVWKPLASFLLSMEDWGGQACRSGSAMLSTPKGLSKAVSRHSRNFLYNDEHCHREWFPTVITVNLL